MTEVAERADYRVGRTAAAATALRIAGATYTEIAETLGFASESEARMAVERDLANRAADAEERALLRATEAARIERLLRSVWGKAIDPNSAEHLPAVRVALSLIDRNSRLMGLDAPTEVIVHAPTAQEIDEWVSRMVGGQNPHYIEADVIVVGDEEPA